MKKVIELTVCNLTSGSNPCSHNYNGLCALSDACSWKGKTLEIELKEKEDKTNE